MRTVFDNAGYIGSTADYTKGILNLPDIYEKTNAGSVVTSGLTVYLDAANAASYPGTGTTWTDLSGNGHHFTLQNATAYTAGPPAHMNFEGSYGIALATTSIPITGTNTVMIFSSIKNSTGDWRTLFRGSSADHQVIVSSGGNGLGMYDNSTAYQGCGFDITSLPNPYTQFNCLTWRLGQSSPYYQFSYNANATTYNITAAAASLKNPIYALGGYQGGSQFWGKIAALLYYNRRLTDTEITQNYTFFKDRFGI